MSNDVFQSTDGRHWEPAIPLPIYSAWPWLRRFVCVCGHASKTEHAYEQHYKQKHLGAPGRLGQRSEDA